MNSKSCLDVYLDIRYLPAPSLSMNAAGEQQRFFSQHKLLSGRQLAQCPHPQTSPSQFLGNSSKGLCSPHSVGN